MRKRMGNRAHKRHVPRTHLISATEKKVPVATIHPPISFRWLSYSYFIIIFRKNKEKKSIVEPLLVVFFPKLSLNSIYSSVTNCTDPSTCFISWVRFFFNIRLSLFIYLPLLFSSCWIELRSEVWEVFLDIEGIKLQPLSFAVTCFFFPSLSFVIGCDICWSHGYWS